MRFEIDVRSTRQMRIEAVPVHPFTFPDVPVNLDKGGAELHAPEKRDIVALRVIPA